MEPVEDCTSPDGHSHVDLMSARSDVPEVVLCGHCGARWTVVVFAAGTDSSSGTARTG
jgi:hypothetical protein